MTQRDQYSGIVTDDGMSVGRCASAMVRSGRPARRSWEPLPMSQCLWVGLVVSVFALSGCQGGGSSAAATGAGSKPRTQEDAMQNLNALQASNKKMIAASVDPTGLAKTAVMMDTMQRTKQFQDDLPLMQAETRKNLMEACSYQPSIPECKDFRPGQPAPAWLSR
jgi:hypothetical protein